MTAQERLPFDSPPGCGHPFAGLPGPCVDCEFRRVDRDPRSRPNEYIVRRRRGRYTRR